jgi:hypothetical protein
VLEIPIAKVSPIAASRMTAGSVTVMSRPSAGIFANRIGATIPFGCEIAPLGDLVTREKKRVASPVVLVTRTLIREEPVTEIGSWSTALSRKPL